MQIYNRKDSEYIGVGHGMTTTNPLRAYMVRTWINDHYVHTYVLEAESDADAIERVKANCRAVIEAEHAQSTLEDLEAAQWYETAENDFGRTRRDLEALITEKSEQYEELADRDDELAVTKRESLMESMIELRGKLKELREAKPVGKPQSVFDRRVHRMAEILASTTRFEVRALGSERVFPVSYFDDSRDILAHVPSSY